MAASAAGGRPRSTRGGSSKVNLAYDLGRKGEAAPAWIGDDPAYSDAYENGVSALDGNGGQTPPPRGHKPAAKKSNVVSINKRRRPGAAKAASQTPDRDAAPDEPELIEPASQQRGSTVIRAGGSLGSAILAMFAYGLLINIVKGTGTKWVNAKTTNGDGKLP